MSGAVESKLSGGVIYRRDFLKTTGLGTLALFAARAPVMAGPFARADFSKLVPADKKLDSDWVKSLYERGAPEVLRGDELKYVGMPIGGICAGLLYLGGDGKLWCWDIFNKHVATGAGHYANPPAPSSPVEQGFAVRVGDEVRRLDRSGFSEITFRGEYPFGVVSYRDEKSAVEVSLEAFSPYVPLNTDDSSLPATVLSFSVRNVSGAAVEAELGGWLENAVGKLSAGEGAFVRRNRVRRGKGGVALECSAEAGGAAVVAKARPDVVFENFEKESYEGWTVSGTAFGSGPVARGKIPGYQGAVGGDGSFVVNSHASAAGGELGAKDDAVGRLTSREFVIERSYISFFIGGGNNPGKTCLNLVVDGKVVASASGANDNQMRRDAFDVRKFAGKTARLEIVDEKAGAWGNIGVDHIVFSDVGATSGPIESRHDYGTLSLALLNSTAADSAVASLPGDNVAAQVFPSSGKESEAGVTKPSGERLVGAVTRKLQLAAGASATVTFVLAWYFPNHSIKGARDQGRFYAKKFASASAVATYVAENFARLHAETKLWRDTWYDSTLPFWFLDRTHLNTSILASSTCFRFDSGRFWAWEGVGCCPGTCGHVWHYAHAMGRLFPELERILREQTDFGLALRDDGAIVFRGENGNIPAIDSQAGSILRALREHQMSADCAFLKRIWPGVKKATGWLIAQDGDGDGIITTGQHNTLDTDWYGPVAWLSGLYHAALLAAAAMADETGDADFARTCRAIFEKGRVNILQLFDGEYFINKVDPAKLNAINSGTGCEIDQVMGQSWAFQVGLPRVFPEKETRSALASLWKYNFTPDVGPYRDRYKPGRWYAMAGEAGLLMCSFPRSDWDYDNAKGKGPDWAAGYFNECMNGFEYQVAGHMIWEGMVQEGLAVTRAVHDRYHASRRNPYNEVECGDHYARSMASYGVYLAACGFEYHGPKGHIGFAPRITPEQFRCAFTAAEGWGTYEQKSENSGLHSKITVKHGRLSLKTIALRTPKAAEVLVTRAGSKIPATVSMDGDRAIVKLKDPVDLTSSATLEIVLR